jgi:hypothetical protein
MSPTKWHAQAMGQTRGGDAYEWSGHVMASGMHVAGNRAIEALCRQAREARKAAKKPQAALEWCRVTVEREKTP